MTDDCRGKTKRQTGALTFIMAGSIKSRRSTWCPSTDFERAEASLAGSVSQAWGKHSSGRWSAWLDRWLDGWVERSGSLYGCVGDG